MVTIQQLKDNPDFAVKCKNKEEGRKIATVLWERDINWDFTDTEDFIVWYKFSWNYLTDLYSHQTVVEFKDVIFPEEQIDIILW